MKTNLLGVNRHFFLNIKKSYHKSAVLKDDVSGKVSEYEEKIRRRMFGGSLIGSTIDLAILPQL